MKSPIIHKENHAQKISYYVAFGQYRVVPTPLCRSTNPLYSKKSQYYMHRNWKYVTCKHCLTKGKKHGPVQQHS